MAVFTYREVGANYTRHASTVPSMSISLNLGSISTRCLLNTADVWEERATIILSTLTEVHI
jgi:hypothetical protein